MQTDEWLLGVYSFSSCSHLCVCGSLCLQHLCPLCRHLQVNKSKKSLKYYFKFTFKCFLFH